MHPSQHAATQPDKPAYTMAASGETVTYRQLEERSNQFAHWLRAQGILAGDHIALLLENHARFFELCWGAQRAGIVFTAISTRLKLDEATYIVDNCAARVLISSPAQAELALALRAQLPVDGPKAVLCLSVGGVLEGFADLAAQLRDQPVTPIADQSAGGDMLYSSGTTGRPKGVHVPPDSPAFDASNALEAICAQHFGMGPDTIYLSPAPLYHAAPMRFCMSVMRLGGSCVLMENFEPEDYLFQLQQHRATHTQLVPTMFVRMLKLAPERRAAYDVSSLRFAIHAAAPCPVPIKRQMIEWWGPVIWEYYAGTEGNGMTLVRAQEWLTHEGTVGRAVIGKLRICDDDGNELPVGETGTVYFAEGRPFAYHGDAAKTAAAANEQGWTTLGDVGHADAEGYLYLTDRKSYMIISGGVNIYPQEVENLLVTHPKVHDVAVFGVPNDEFGEEVKAVVQPADMAQAGPELAAELIAFCHAHLSGIKCPKSVDFEAELPRHATGKLYKRLLRDRYWAGRVSKII